MMNGSGMSIELMMDVGRQVMTSPAFYFLLGAMLVDFITGVGKAFVTGTYSSKIGIDGIVKHSMVILLAVFIGFFFRLFGIAPVGQVIKAILALNYVVSILENIESTGVYMPQSIKDLFIQMRNDAEEKLINENININIIEPPVDPVEDGTKKGVDR